MTFPCVCSYNEKTQILPHIVETYKNVIQGDVEDAHNSTGVDKLFIILLHLPPMSCIALNRSHTTLHVNRNLLSK